MWSYKSVQLPKRTVWRHVAHLIILIVFSRVVLLPKVYLVDTFRDSNHEIIIRFKSHKSHRLMSKGDHTNIIREDQAQHGGSPHQVPSLRARLPSYCGHRTMWAPPGTGWPPTWIRWSHIPRTIHFKLCEQIDCHMAKTLLEINYRCFLCGNSSLQTIVLYLMTFCTVCTSKPYIHVSIYYIYK